jgi:hypothetical protein
MVFLDNYKICGSLEDYTQQKEKKMKKLGVFVMSVCLLGFGLALVSCDSDNGDGGSWEDVSSINQLSGRWTGNSNPVTMSFKDAFDPDDEWWDSEAEAMFGNINLTIYMNFDITINASAETQSGTMVQIFRFHGGNINTVWPILKEDFAGDGASINDLTHSVSYTNTINNEPLDEDFLVGVEISEDGREIRFSLDDMFDNAGYVILRKQS